MHAGQSQITKLRAQLAIAVTETKVFLSPTKCFALNASKSAADQLIQCGSRNAEEQDQISWYTVLLLCLVELIQSSTGASDHIMGNAYIRLPESERTAVV